MSSPSEIRSESADSTGATVRTGEQIRTRRRARLIRFAIRRDNASPNPGVNQARTLFPATRTGLGSTKPLSSTIPFDQSCSKSAVKSAASFVDSAITITFSWRVHESSVQFADPVHTASPSRTDVLVVHQIGDARDRPVRHAQRRDQLDVRLRRRRHGNRVPMADVVDHPHRDPARCRGLDRPAHELCGLGRQVEVVLREIE